MDYLFSSPLKMLFSSTRLCTSGLIALSLASPVIAQEAQEVNVYSQRQPELLQPLVDAYTAETGVKLNIAYIGKGMLERLKAEGKRSPADLIMTVDIARLSEVKNAGVTQPVDSSVLEANIPANLRDRDNEWFGLTSRARVIYASNERIPQNEQITYESLADPKWKGRICTRSGLSDYNLALISAMIVHHGEEKTKAWLKGLKDNLARTPQGGDRDQAKAIVAGECDIAIGNTYYIGEMLKDPEQRPVAEAIHVIFPTFSGGGTHINISGIAMTKAAPNKDEAQKFMEWLSGDEAQQLYAEINYEYPVKPGTKRSDLVESWGRFIADDLNLDEIAKQRSNAVRLVEEVNFDG